MTVNLIATDQDYLDKIKDQPFDPIFIMGDQRSGTTLLYKLLVLTNKFNYISAYDVIEYNNIISNFYNKTENEKRKKIDTFLASKGMHSRGFDTVGVNSSLPEEYGFILKNNSSSSKTNTDNFNIFLEACQKIQKIRGKENPILLKNPNDFSNIEFLSNSLENSKFIVILRNEEDIAKSKRRAAIHLFSRYHHYTGMLSDEYKEYYGSIFWRIVIKLYFSRFNIFLKSIFLKEIREYRSEFNNSINNVDSKKYLIITYEDLCSDANQVIYEICEFLNIKFDREINFSSMIIKK